MRKPKFTFNSPRSPSVWPKPKFTEASDAQQIVAHIPDYIERAREAFGCIKSRCDRAVKKGASIKLNNIERQCDALLVTLDDWRREVDGLIAENTESGLF